MTTSDGNTPQEKIAKIIAKAAPAAKKPRKTTKKQPLTPQAGVIYVAGNGNVVAGGDVTQHITNTVHNHAPAPAPARPKVVVKTADGTINAEQKAELLRLKNEWLLAHNAVKAKPLSHQAASIRLNAAMKVSSYAELKPEQFEKARAWLIRQTAMVRAMPSAARKDAKWRNARYKAIKTRCKNQLGDEYAYRPYIKREFKADSLTELGDQELERTYRYVMGKNAQTGSGTAQT